MKILKKFQDYFRRITDPNSYPRLKKIYAIPDLDDKTEALRLYLYHNQNDTEGDSWYYMHNPLIVSFINSFSEKEALQFCESYLLWGEKLFSNLADPFLYIKNPYINGIYEYSRIFLAVKEYDNREYIIENLIIITGEDAQFNLEHKQHLLKKVTEVSKELNRTFPKLEILLKEDIANLNL